MDGYTEHQYNLDCYERGRMRQKLWMVEEKLELMLEAGEFNREELETLLAEIKRGTWE